jgi:hypothetical protein
MKTPDLLPSNVVKATGDHPNRPDGTEATAKLG